ncbi:MAG: OmpA family protein [Verrucomicrobia bacterium]|nr:OmpA family protein [Verrucomicrobiota bacterium]MBV9297433.1 OmpA family protein [Verrucomicrobiota bacterium]MBV9644401.1 OmpA family protein [Verrucomicrobiota bacterium]
MADYSEDLIADSAVSLKHWFLPAIALSFVFHCALLYFFSQKTLDRFVPADTPRLVPRSFNIGRLQVDQKLLESDSKLAEKPGKSAVDLGTIKNLTQFDGSFEKDIQEFRATPEVSSPEVSGLKEKPSVDTQSAQKAAAKAKVESAVALDKELSEVRQQLLSDKPDVPTSRPKIATGNKKNPGRTDNQDVADTTISGNAGVPAGFSNLDALLAGSGQLGSGTAPILMPTDLLFDYDSAILRPGATASLQKLGRLIQANPQAIFKVEGHTDSFGSDRYNLDLSQRRAETVKGWLVENMSIEPDRIQTQGYGKTRLIVPADRSVEEQQLNRRVEIVIRTKKS